MNLSIIILNFNTPQLTLNCIQSIYYHYNQKLESQLYEIILIDNKSTDNSILLLDTEIKKQKWKLKFIKSEKNNGFGSGCNKGAKLSKGKYLLFLNSDTIIKDSSLSKMMSFLKSNKFISILGGIQLNLDGTSKEAFGKYPNFYYSIMIFLGLGRKIMLRNLTTNLQIVDWVSGGYLFVNRKVFQTLNGFDENIFMYFEDVELCYRANKLDIKSYHYPNNPIVHIGGRSSNNNFIINQSYKGYLYFYKKHKNELEYTVINSLFQLKFKIYCIFGRLIKNIDLVETYNFM